MIPWVDIKEDNTPFFAYGNKYKFKMVDIYGWDITMPMYRDIRINSLMDIQQRDNILYHMYLIRPNKPLDVVIVYVDLSKKNLSVSGDDIHVSFRCDSIEHAEDIIDMILEPNGLKVSPVNCIE